MRHKLFRVTVRASDRKQGGIPGLVALAALSRRDHCSNTAAAGTLITEAAQTANQLAPLTTPPRDDLSRRRVFGLKERQ